MTTELNSRCTVQKEIDSEVDLVEAEAEASNILE